MTKPANRMSVRDEKAAALDNFVKSELARTKAVNQAKLAKLKALRIERDQANAAVGQPSAQGKAVSRKRLHLPRSS